MRAGSLRAAAAALCVGALTAFTAFAVPSSASPASRHSHGLTRLVSGQPRFVTFGSGQAPRSNLAASVPKLQVWTTTVKDHGHVFHDSLVGLNPMVKQAHPSSTTKVVVIPVEIKLPDSKAPGGFLVSNPAVVQPACDTQSVLNRTLQSPLFASHTYVWGGTKIGTTQYEDAFQRSEFWKYTSSTGINPGYHVLLSHVTTPTQVVTVPAQYAAAAAGGCLGFEGAAYIGWWDAELHTIMANSSTVKSLVSANVLPLFLTEDFVLYTNPNNVNTSCCVLGYHSALSERTGATQTYAFTGYQNTAVLGGGLPKSDVAGLSHELGEWMNDPFVNNPTLPWGHIGQVSSCQSNFEVGDPLSGHTVAVPIGSYTYHVQELAYFSWFYHQSPSIGVHGWYSSQGTFKTSAKPCS